MAETRLYWYRVTTPTGNWLVTGRKARAVYHAFCAAMPNLPVVDVKITSQRAKSGAALHLIKAEPG